MTGEPDGCTCDPQWPSLVVPTEAGSVTVEPAATPGPIASLFWAYCADCGAIYPDAFRRAPRADRRDARASSLSPANATASQGSDISGA